MKVASTASLVWRVAAALALSTCGPALPDVPSHGGPAWVELQTDHFTLWTDAGASRGRELVTNMEHLRQVLYGVAFRKFVTDERSLVIALRDISEVHVFIPEQFVAVTFTPNVDEFRHGMIVMPADDRPDTYGDVVTHELAHLISFTAIHRQPGWFAEGLAKFFEATHIDGKTGHVDVGVPPRDIVRALPRMRPLPSAPLFECSKLECKDYRFYVSAWALFSFLINSHAEELADYEARIDRGEDNDTAWEAAFTSLPRDAIDRELHTWLVAGKHVVWHFDAKLAEHAIVERPLGDADAYAARALLRFHFQRNDPALPSDIAGALAADPQNKLARAVQAALARAQH